VSLRTLFRAIDDATRERTGVEEDADYADTVRRTTASLLERMATVIREFGRVLTAEPGEGRRAGESRLAASLAAMASGRALVADLLIGDPRSRTGLWELNSALLTTVDRMLDELGPGPADAQPVPVQARATLRATRRLRRGRPS
jgi:hypothetical protein